jgi:hypothetical protein
LMKAIELDENQSLAYQVYFYFNCEYWLSFSSIGYDSIKWTGSRFS